MTESPPESIFSGSSATEQHVLADLQREHVLILRATIALERCAARLSSPGGGPEAEPEHLRTLLSFFRDFVDGWHHRKEEEILVPSLLHTDLSSEEGHLQRIVDEHVLSSDFLARLQSPDPTEVLATIPIFTDFLRQHLTLEERTFLPLVERNLDAKAKQRVAEEFAHFDDRMGGADVMKRFEQDIAALLEPLSVLDPKPSRPW